MSRPARDEAAGGALGNPACGLSQKAAAQMPVQITQKRTAAKIHQGTSTRGMGLPVNLAVANSGAGPSSPAQRITGGASLNVMFLVHSMSLQKHQDKPATNEGQSAVSFQADLTEFSKDVLQVCTPAGMSTALSDLGEEREWQVKELCSYVFLQHRSTRHRTALLCVKRSKTPKLFAV
ncbi:hypothetical protein Anapl_02332 [Anas platyrhynchos]|uniref:Uncharacterized protein n=1 Tax=Anas platyrhynchos TaxID=8839 RepID=R0JUK5_ANAPL|nr:hypothetical protein Anapl_02332 [Anas platyrhynchos]